MALQETESKVLKRNFKRINKSIASGDFDLSSLDEGKETHAEKINNLIDTYFPRWYTKCKFCRGVHFGVLIGAGIMGAIWVLTELV